MVKLNLSGWQALTPASSLERWIIASVCFSLFLLMVRILLTYSPAFLFLPWNLFLAFVPYFISTWITRNVKIIEKPSRLILTLGVWILFMPNSFYIITDLFHLNHESTIYFGKSPRWFDLLLIFSFAWNGLIAGIISLRHIETIVSIVRGRGFSIFLVFSVMWLCAFGIYIGRFLRFNSWDVISDPFALISEIWETIVHPFENSYAWGMTLCYSIFMTLIYFTARKLNEVIPGGNFKK